MKDFDILAPPKRTAKIGGEEVDVTFIPARAALEFINFSKKHDVKKLEALTEENLDLDILGDTLDIVALVCQRTNKKITKDWLLDNSDMATLMAFVQYVFASINKTNVEAEDNAGEGGESKN
jgi:hypothetical protein